MICIPGVPPRVCAPQSRRDPLTSTGPNTEGGKRRSRQNAVRYGLCAKTGIEILEAVDNYSGFEPAVVADYDAQTAVEHELVLRLASLLLRSANGRRCAIAFGRLDFKPELIRVIAKRCRQRTITTEGNSVKSSLCTTSAGRGLP
jgi:hypothetical protein